MPRPFAMVVLLLTAVTAFMVGLIASGWSSGRSEELPVEQAAAVRTAAPAPAGVPPPVPETIPASTTPPPPSVAHALLPPGAIDFADVAERINPAVVNIEASTRSTGMSGRRRREMPEGPPSGPGSVRPQSGSGFVIESSGEILTNYHVIQNAERIMVKFADGRSLQARVLGVDPDTDIALIKVEAQRLAVAPLGDSRALRVGEWVCAIGNPLAYEHTVTVGVVSYLGRKLFDSSLDNYIQTDAAINFGNSGGPLINGRGEVVGINSAISQRASNIGFAVPINEARSILPQLRTEGRVARG